MSVLTPTANTRVDSVSGDQRTVIARFTSVADGDTWVTGLGYITDANVTSGSSTPKAMSITNSGGTVTFHVTSGPDTNSYVDIMGY